MGQTGRSGKPGGTIPVYQSHVVSAGGLLLGGHHPVRIQSMANTDTNDVDASVEQCLRMRDAGAELLRLTTQGQREVESLGKVRELLSRGGCDAPLVADIHFSHALALKAALVAHKIRINPGNYLRGKQVDDLLPELLRVCMEHRTVLRIGVNHGSLDTGILEQFGATPVGMVESAMPFLRKCRDMGFDQVVVSMKASNPVVMVQSVRLLVHTMMREGMNYPLHLGVTEAGDGAEGRIKSTVGMAPLLLEGMGDTLRVSLTEPPEQELPVAHRIRRWFPKPVSLPYDPFNDLAWDPFSYRRRKTTAVIGIGGGSVVKVISELPPREGFDLPPERIRELAVSFARWKEDPALLGGRRGLLLLEKGPESIQETKASLNTFCSRDSDTPVVIRMTCHEEDGELFRTRLAGELGSLLVDGAVDGVWVENGRMDRSSLNDFVLSVLQASGARMSKTEYIACPSCGRTHFDILARLREIRSATSHLSTLKIGVMGCIVNGPGEMADAHFGYVGAGPGRVTLYKGRVPVRRNLPEGEALDALIELLKEEGVWRDPG